MADGVERYLVRSTTRPCLWPADGWGYPPECAPGDHCGPVQLHGGTDFREAFRRGELLLGWWLRLWPCPSDTTGVPQRDFYCPWADSSADR